MGVGTLVIMVHMHNACAHWTVRVLVVASGWSSYCVHEFDPCERTGPRLAEPTVDDTALLQCMATTKKDPLPLTCH